MVYLIEYRGVPSRHAPCKRHRMIGGDSHFVISMNCHPGLPADLHYNCIASTPKESSCRFACLRWFITTQHRPTLFAADHSPSSMTLRAKGSHGPMQSTARLAGRAIGCIGQIRNFIDCAVTVIGIARPLRVTVQARSFSQYHATYMFFLSCRRSFKTFRMERASSFSLANQTKVSSSKDAIAFLISSARIPLAPGA